MYSSIFKMPSTKVPQMPSSPKPRAGPARVYNTSRGRNVKRNVSLLSHSFDSFSRIHFVCTYCYCVYLLSFYSRGRRKKKNASPDDNVHIPVTILHRIPDRFYARVRFGGVDYIKTNVYLWSCGLLFFELTVSEKGSGSDADGNQNILRQDEFTSTPTTSNTTNIFAVDK
jgi:hypothetical protein